MYYEKGQQYAFKTLGLKYAAVAPILVKQRKDPLSEIHHRLARVFKLKTPKFDMSALLKRALRNPFKQPRLHLSGKLPPLKM
ncbi:MAG: hypothetical protein PVI90_00055 [Desulfobacteraceae bacterium]|jgi:hypothetical protein